LLAAFVAGFTMDAIGRKLTMLFLCVPFSVGWSVIATSKSYIALLIGRFVTGWWEDENSQHLFNSSQ